MNVDAFHFGFRIVGPCSADRRLADWYAAFAAYAECDGRAHVECEAYLSAFTFTDDFAEHLRRTGSTRGFAGPCCSPWLWFDIDRDASAGGIDAALCDARKLAVALADRYRVDDGSQLWFYSGSKGFHAGIPTALWGPEPGTDFHRIARRFAETIAEVAGVSIDKAVYDKVRAFRAPNSRHPKTGRYKRRLTVDEVMHLAPAAILQLAEKPEPFELPEPPAGRCAELATAWGAAAEQVRTTAEGVAQRRAAAVVDGAKLNRSTFDFIRDGAAVGDRHRLLYSAAANLAELGCPPALAYELLTEAALDAGLPPSEVRRQIDCGLKDGGKGAGA
jgi:hypothetical protein